MISALNMIIWIKGLGSPECQQPLRAKKKKKKGRKESLAGNTFACT